MHKIVIAITGASGSIYAKLLLDKLLTLKCQWSDIAVVLSSNAQTVWETELDASLNEYKHKDERMVFYGNQDFFAPFASGSGKYNTMIIVPCSMGTMGRIAGGISNDLISRAADVVLKERRKLICVAREMPYNLIHIKNMETITLAGGIICPATPSYYSKPKSIEALVGTVVDRIIDLAGLDQQTYRWGGDQ
jgi:4-hydroxy-3-polyprenylbenzoate decarboxylase